MTDLNTANLQDPVNNALQEALGKNISSKKTSILLWTNGNPKYPNSFILKDKDGKKYLGLVRKDRRGENYWSFREISQKSNQSKISLEKSPVMDNVAKFQHRQEQAKNYANNANASKE